MREILVAAAVSLLLSMLGTPLAIRLFSRRGYGQSIREEGPSGHHDKRGTPTMGGTVIVIAALVGFACAHLYSFTPPTVSAVLVLFLMTGLGAVGFLDDFIKIYKQRSLGLRSGAKALGQLIVGAVFAVLVTRFPNAYLITPAETRLSFLRDFGPSIGLIGFTIWVLIMIVGFSNAVNLTDGLDGPGQRRHRRGAGLVRADRQLAAAQQLHHPARAQLLLGPRPAGPRRGRRRGARRAGRVPVVERPAREDLHG
ncbi:hypothetical protein GCM10018952_56300 [Streptosporangium vulgare]